MVFLFFIINIIKLQNVDEQLLCMTLSLSEMEYICILQAFNLCEFCRDSEVRHFILGDNMLSSFPMIDVSDILNCVNDYYVPDQV